jgi:Fur family ferric uptake transcriptional regulator
MLSHGNLKNTGLKATLPRLTILELFHKSGQRHMSAEDVYRLVLNERADIGLATIYRVLMQFEQAGLLTRSQFESGKAVYELNEGQHHDHLVCLDCGRVEEFFDAEIERYNKIYGHEDIKLFHDVKVIAPYNLTLDVDTTTVKLKEKPGLCRKTILKCLGLKWEIK